MRYILSFIKYFGFFALFLCCSLAFYQTTNNLYPSNNGGLVDYSLWGWAGMFIIWGYAFFSYKKYSNQLPLAFAAQLSILCFALDCWRLFIFATNLQMKYWILGIVALELLAALLAFLSKYRTVAGLALVVALIVFGGMYVLLPIILPMNALMLIAFFISIICFVILTPLLTRKNKLYTLYALIFVSLLYSGNLFYHSFHGIGFWEPKIHQPASSVKVSIIVPIYNAETTLKRCLDSLRKQTLRDIEIICVNDGSTDKSADILAQYAAHDARFKIITQSNQGSGAARDAGMKIARGEYVGFVDSDDFVDLNYFKTLYDKARNINADIAVADGILLKTLRGTKRLYYRVRARNTLQTSIFYKTNLLLGTCIQWDKIYKRDLLSEHHIYNSHIKTIGEDCFFSLAALMYADEILIVPNADYYYQPQAKSMSFTPISKSHLQAMLDLYQSLYDYIETSSLSTYDKIVWNKAVSFMAQCELASFARKADKIHHTWFQNEFNRLLPMAAPFDLKNKGCKYISQNDFLM